MLGTSFVPVTTASRVIHHLLAVLLLFYFTRDIVALLITCIFQFRPSLRSKDYCFPSISAKRFYLLPTMHPPPNFPFRFLNRTTFFLQAPLN